MLLVYELPVMPFRILSFSQFPPFVQAWLPSPVSVDTVHNFHQFSSVQLLSRVWLFMTLCTAACLASLSITNSWNLLKLMFLESVMPTNHLILCHPLLLLPLIFASIRVFSNESVLCLRWPKYWPKYSFIGKSKILGSSFSESKFVSLLLLSFFCLLETWNKSVLSYYVENFCMSPLYSWPSILISTFFTWCVVSPFTML